MLVEAAEIHIEQDANTDKLLLNRVPTPSEIDRFDLLEQRWEIRAQNGIIYGYTNNLFYSDDVVTDHWIQKTWFPQLPDMAPVDRDYTLAALLDEQFQNEARNLLLYSNARIIFDTGLGGEPQVLVERNILRLADGSLVLARANMASPLYTREFLDRDLKSGVEPLSEGLVNYLTTLAA